MTLEADGITLNFDKRSILSSVYIKCETGRITGLLGRNGEGKSCLMNIIYGRLQPQSKSVRINGISVFQAWKDPRLIRYAPQFNFIPGPFSVKRAFSDFNVDFHEFCSHFEEFDLFYETSMKNLSGGYRRLVEIYVIMRSDAAFVMLDEPFSHIMPLHIEKLRALLAEEKKYKGILISDHLYEHIIEISDPLFLLSRGNTYPISAHSQLETLGYVPW